MTDSAYPVPDDAADRLKRGAWILIAIFWSVHLAIMLIRAELQDTENVVGFGESFVRRAAFALFGAFIGYILYLLLRRLRRHDFLWQVSIGAALALIAACIQATGNAVVFNSDRTVFLYAMLYALLYWFWFYFCWTTAYLALAYSITIQQQERHAAELSVQAQEAQVRALRYQINPHFLFNTLNAIAALVRDAPDKAEEMVVRLSEFFRRSLAVNPMEDLTLAEEVDLQRLYLEIEHTRFPERLRFDVALDPETNDARVSALLLQPLVENAVKHGVARSEAPTCIRILSRFDGPMLEVVVENDASGTGPGAKGERVGLHNVRERLRSRFGDGASLSSGELPEGGYRNTIRIPFSR